MNWWCGVVMVMKTWEEITKAATEWNYAQGSIRCFGSSTNTKDLWVHLPVVSCEHHAFCYT